MHFLLILIIMILEKTCFKKWVPFLVICCFLSFAQSNYCSTNQYSYQDNDYAALCQNCMAVVTQCSRCTAQCNSLDFTACTVNCTSCYPRYFPNTFSQCQKCSSIINNCLYCTNSTFCTQCFPKYYLSISGVGMQSCSLCSTAIVGCLSCSSNASCTKCDSAHLLNNSTFQCTPCSTIIANCSQCNSGTWCTTCLSNPNINFNPNTYTCDFCIILNCLTCSSDSSKCLDCIEGYYINSNICSSCMGSCAICNSLTTCFVCMAGYYLTAIPSCLPCPIANCLRCSPDGSSCYSCTANTYFLASSTLCSVCVAPCATCHALSGTFCVSCNSTSLLMRSSHTCVSCSWILASCSACSEDGDGTPICTSCVTNMSLYLDNCYPCNYKDAHCNSCNIDLLCLGCLDTFFLQSMLCRPCISPCYTCTSFSTNCLICQPYAYSPPQCILCSTFDPDCQACTVVHICTWCTNQSILLSGASVCTSCVGTFYADVNNTVCSPCQIPCLTCSSLASCLVCAVGYTFQNDNATSMTLCKSVCGDQIVAGNQQCDQGVGLQYSGCSDSCQVEANFVCDIFHYSSSASPSVTFWTQNGLNSNNANLTSSTQSAASMSANPSLFSFELMTDTGNFSVCSFQGSIQYSVNRIYLQQFANQMTISISVTPALYSLSTRSGNLLFKIVNSNFTTTDFNSSLQGSLIFTGTFNTDLKGQSMTFALEFTGNDDLRFVYTPIVNFTCGLNPNNGKIAYSYSSDQYSFQKMAYYVGLSLGGAILLLVIVTIFTKSLSGLELALTAQFVFVSTIFYDQYPYLPYEVLNALTYSTGFNIKSSWSQNPDGIFHSFNQVNTLQINSADMSSNFNLIALLYLLPIILGVPLLTLKFIRKKTWRDFSQKWSSFFLKELLMYFCLFNLTYFLSSLVIFDFKQIHVKQKGSFFSNVIILFCILITAYTLIRFIQNANGFGRFTTSFQKNPLGSKFYLVIPINMVLSVVMLGYLRIFPLGPSMFQLFILVYIIIYRPYKTIQDNIRSGFNFLLMILATLMKLIYNFTTEEARRNSAFLTFSPTIILALLVIATIFSILNEVYQIYQFCKKSQDRNRIVANVKFNMEEGKPQETHRLFLQEFSKYSSTAPINKIESMQEVSYQRPEAGSREYFSQLSKIKKELPKQMPQNQIIEEVMKREERIEQEKEEAERKRLFEKEQSLKYDNIFSKVFS